MPPSKSSLVKLNYGAQGVFSCEIGSERIAAWHAAPPADPRFLDELQGLLIRPLDFPPLEQAVVPGDRVVLAVDRQTPAADYLLADVWEILKARNVKPEDVVILQPVGTIRSALTDPRRQLPEEIRQRMSWKIHDPSEPEDQAYLAASADGERIYLARELIEADLVVSIGQIAYDPILGYRGTHSIFYPGLSSSDAVTRARGQGHQELEPDDDRPLRQLIDEVAWLLGVQFSIQVVAAERGGVAHVLAGACDTVFRRGKELLDDQWMVELDSRTEMVVAAVDCDNSPAGWEQIGAALETARNLVVSGGKIILLTELNAESGRGLQMICDSESPRDALLPLRQDAPADLVPATQLASAVDWADVYLLSELENDIVEDLFLIPLENEQEVQRLLNVGGSCLFLGGAQHTFGRVRSE